MNNFLKLIDLSTAEIFELLDLAEQLKYEQKNDIPHPLLKGKTIGLIFEKASTRTRVSFEVGMTQLGGYPLYLAANDTQIGRGEPIKDTARVLSRYLDGIMIRTFAQSKIEELAQYATIPIINGLTDEAHPCQVLADLMTIREYKGTLEGLKLCYLGDGNNMANSLLVGGLKVGMEVAIATPKGYEPHPKALEFAANYKTAFSLYNKPDKAVQNADVVITDVWTSMGQEEETAKRKIDFAGYQINTALMQQAKKEALVLHCLPAHREEEISSTIFEEHANEIFEEAENRLHIQKAIMAKLMG